MRSMLTMLWIVGALCCSVAAQDDHEEPVTARQLDPARAMFASRVVDAAVRSLDASLINDNEAGEYGAEVVLRMDGVVLGRSAVFGGQAPLRTATGEAIEAFIRRVAPEGDALTRSRIGAIAQRLVIDVTICGPLIPSPTGDFGQIAASMDPGAEGVGVRLADRTLVVFPRQLREGSPDAALAMRSLVSRLTGEPQAALRSAGELRRAGMTFGRIGTIEHRVQAPGANPIELRRGAPTEPARAITSRDLLAMREALLRSLASRVYADGATTRVAGTIHAGRGPDEATPDQRALLAMTLAMALRGADAEDPLTALAGGALGELLDEVARETRETNPPRNTMALWAITGEALHACDPALREKILGQKGVAPFLERCALAIETEIRAADRLGAPAPGYLLAPCAMRAVRTGDVALMQAASGAERRLRERTAVGDLVGQAPWLGWAQQALSKGAERPGALDTRDMLGLVWTHQIMPEDVRPRDADFVGGIVFTRSASPLPSWHSARPLITASGTLANTTIVPPEERRETIQRLLRSIGFLRSLSIDSARASIYASAPIALGAIQVSPWEATLPVEASAMTLLAVDELLRSLRAIASGE